MTPTGGRQVEQGRPVKGVGVMGRLSVAALVLCVSCRGAPAGPDGTAPGAEGEARRIIASAGTNVGLCVHLNVTDGRLTAALAERGRFLVHGLARTRARAVAARRHVASRGVYGKACIERGRLGRLPHADNLANVVVVEDLADARRHGLSLADVTRVLRPGGTACLGGGRTIVKPRPAGMDEWTHWRHDPDGTELSSDTLVGPSARLQWVDGPAWPRDNNPAAAAVFAAGRAFCLMNEGPAGAPRWVLIARDAYNGLVLWKRGVVGPDPRLVVAVGRRVFTVLAKGGPPVALDAATGEVVKTYDVGASPFIILYLDGALTLGAARGICSVDAATGAVRWRTPAPDGASFRREDRPNQPSDSDDKLPLMVTGGGRLFVFIQDAPKPPYSLACYDLSTGRQQWRARHAGELLGHYKGVLAVAERTREATWKRPGEGVLRAVSADDGRELWRRPRMLRLQRSAILFAAGLMWVTDDRREGGASPLVGLDCRTGEEVRRVPASLRTQCSAIRATGRYFIGAMAGFADGRTGKGFHTPFYKAACRIGQFPANGLMYNFPHVCVCYPYLRGFQAFAPAPAGKSPQAATAPAARLEKGPAYGFTPAPADAAAEWNTYRHDPGRRGATTEAVDPKIRLLWRETVAAGEPTPYGKPVTPPVVAGGTVFVATGDACEVRALDARTGRPRWRRLIGGRVEVAPTIHEGLCLFGAGDGWVYCLRAADGELVWRFRAAPEERRIVARGRVESAWPVPGVLVEGGKAHFAAGRDAKSDDGIALHAIEPFSGKAMWTKRLRRVPWGRFFVNDLLVASGTSLSMSAYIYDPAGGERRADLKGGGFFRSGTTRSIGLMPFGFLYDRKDGAETCVRYKYTYWSYRGVKGVVLAFTADKIFGITHTRGKRWRLFARRAGAAADAAKDAAVWSADVPPGTLALLPAGKVVFTAGPAGPPAAKGGMLRCYSADDGRKLSELILDDVPVFDGLAAAGGRLYVSAQSGRVYCFGAPAGGD